jgi:hypothetical protein
MSTAIINSINSAQTLKLKSLTERLPAHPDAAKIRASIEAALGTAEEFGRRKNTLRQSGKYTDAGLKDALRTEVQKTYAARLNNARRPVAVLKKRLDALKAEIKPRQPDPQNIVAELQRQEMRAFLADLPDFAARMQLVLQNPQFAEAAIQAPPELSGIDPRNFKLVLDKHLEELHGEKMKEIEALDELVTAGEAALQMAQHDMGKDFGDEREFGKLMAATRFKPWLKKYTENGQGVVRTFTWDPDALNGNGNGNGSWVLASPGDVADGEFFSTADDFFRSNGVPDDKRDDFWRTRKAAA